MERKPLIPKVIETVFTLQQHITNHCDRQCEHCYLTDKEKKNSEKDALTTDECKNVIDQMVQLGRDFRVVPRINFSGGNPLLRQDFLELIKYAKDNLVRTAILGNPYPLTEKTLDILVENNLYRYQLSLDGTKETHDMFRGNGSYDMTLEGIRKIADKGIWVSIMSTVSRLNYKQMPEIAEISLKNGARHFDFARLVPIGEGKNLDEDQLTPLEYKEFLFDMHKVYEKLSKQGAKTGFFGRKDPLWSLLYKEMGILPPHNKTQVYDGCTLGKSGLTLDVDGTLYACRRMPISLGNIRNTTLKETFLQNELLDKYRQFEKIDGCNECDLMTICRGCRAIAHGNTGNYFSRDPQCWRGQE